MPEALQTAPNGAVPAYRRKPALDAADPKGHAAGVLFMADDGDILLLRRGGKVGVDNFVGHWALPGGGVDEGETPEIGADREVREEMGIEPPARKRLLDQTATPNGMVFHTFAAPAADKFVPKLNPEHTGYAWAPLEMLPRPLHPAVEKMLADRIGAADDAKCADFLKWMAEDDDDVVGDSVFLIAMDRDSVREKRSSGQLIVKRTHISKANVCPYRGNEIPGWEALGLEKDKVYQMLRDPEELRKGASTLNGVQLLIKHIPVHADDHRPDETVGSLGTDAIFDGVYLDNSLFVNARHAIDAIETGEQKQLSAGYHYKPDMTPGNFRGTDYDGVMRDIVFNHVALVEDGRAGPDVVVGDSKENLDMPKTTRIAALALSMTAASIAPLLAMDSKVNLTTAPFKDLTTKNFKDSKDKLLSGVRSAIDGKLRPGIALDATMEGLAKAIDAFQDMPVEMDSPLTGEREAEMIARAAVEPVAPAATVANTGFDAEPFKAFLKEKGVNDEDIAKACDMLPKPGAAKDEKTETDEEKAAREKKEADDKTAKDNEMKDMVSKPAMDAALKKMATDTATAVRATEREIRAALAEVKPWVGELAADMAFDSGADVRRHALEMLGVPNAKTMHADALGAVLSAQPKPGAQPSDIRRDNVMALDAAGAEGFHTRFPGSDRIKAA